MLGKLIKKQTKSMNWGCPRHDENVKKTEIKVKEKNKPKQKPEGNSGKKRNYENISRQKQNNYKIIREN